MNPFDEMNEKQLAYRAEMERRRAFIDGDAAGVNHPPHYTSHPSGIEVIEITRLLPADLANAVKYVCRHRNKGRPVQDLQKAAWYVRDARDHPDLMTLHCYVPRLISLMTRYVIKEPQIEVQEILADVLDAVTEDGKVAVQTKLGDALHRIIDLGLAYMDNPELHSSSK